MKTILAYLQLFPAILASVKSLEDTVPIPGAGKAKLDLILGFVQAAYNAEQSIQKEIPWSTLVEVVKGAVTAIVTAFNAIGVFKKSA